MVRKASTRSKKFEASIDPETIANKFRAQKELMVELQTPYFAEIAEMERKTKVVCEQAGVTSFMVAQYINVARQCYHISKNFSGLTANNEAQVLVDKWSSRGLNEALLVEICSLCGLSPASAEATLAGFPSYTFWSVNIPRVNITNIQQNLNLPNIVVPAFPTTLTVWRVIAVLKVPVIVDLSGLDNAINNVAFQLAVDADPLYASTVQAIIIPDDSWEVDVSEFVARGGDAINGTVDVSAEIVGAGTFYARLENAQSDGATLRLLDVGWGLKFLFTI